MAEAYGIVIAGGGPVGAALALGLRASRHRIALLEARAPGETSADARMIALSHGSRLILERSGVWPELADVTPITTIVISQQRRFGRVELTAREAGVPALGYMASYSALRRSLVNALADSGIQVLPGCIARAFDGRAQGAALEVECAGVTTRLEANLVAFADGAEGIQLARIEEREYRQSALICNVRSESAHRNRAFERFTPEGPIALLPSTHGWSLVWTARPAHVIELAALDPQAFCAKLHTAFGASLGRFTMAGERQVFPLKLKYARRPDAPRAVLIGNAAQTLHPVAGQGLNLGLRDAWELATAIRDANDAGAAATISAYVAGRRFDRTATIAFTDTLIRLFSNDIPLLDRAGAAGLTIFGGIPACKNFLVRRMMFGARG
ncbi:MAG TPA: FAD-dependent monooxygenase [Burkholderiales bacterium]|nr:FAD-dependent monooxygenase [Burkholderiales bacterium]